MTEGIIHLSDIERAAKEHFLLHFREGSKVPCDIDMSTIEAKLPTWFDETKYKRGQRYFWDNRFGILQSNMTGLICLLAEPRGLRVLASTGRSSTVETARKRYLATIMHTLSWYEYDLSPGSKSWESLNKVRKMHYLASKSAESKKIGRISQSEIAFTSFGFMGFVLVRPHMLGIRHDNREDREAFIHQWAVLLHMLGVQDKFNICLLPFDVLEVICRMFLRYIIIPLVQIETPEFKHMVSVMLEGMSIYLPNMTYEYQIFQTRRIVGVPGYQFRIDKEKEILCRNLLTQNEIDECNEIIFNVTKSRYLQISYNIPIIETNFITINNDTSSKDDNSTLEFIGTYTTVDYDDEQIDVPDTNFVPIELKIPENIKIRYLNYEKEWQENLNDTKFYDLSSKTQRIVKMWTNLQPVYENTIGRYFVECFISLIMYWMKKAYKSSRS